MAKNTKYKHKKSNTCLPKHLMHINKMAAGIDIGSKSHFVAVPDGCAKETVREFSSFTVNLNELADWLTECGIETIAMESTGVYWVPLYELLESRGFDVNLVDARKVKNVSGRKTDVLDCQWLQQLHTYGLLTTAFRPDDQTCIIRSYMRQRASLIKNASIHINHMQKALSQMNIHLNTVLSDITGVTGLKIIRAIVEGGERNPKTLAALRHKQCKRSEEDIEKSLTGSYRNEHLFALKQALELYDIYKQKIIECDHTIEAELVKYKSRSNNKVNIKKKKSNSNCKNKLTFDATSHIVNICGVDLAQVPGLEATSALNFLSEIGNDITQWKTAKHFASWLCLCPGNKISGGKVLSGRTIKSTNIAAQTLRLAARTLHGSKSSLGAFYRRMRTKLGAPKAITAAAHKLAVIIYNMIKNQTEYEDLGQDYYENKYRTRVLNNLSRRAKDLGFTLVKNELTLET